MVQNVRLINQNFTRSEGYFFSFDHQTDVMIQKADDGTLAFAYPLDTPVSNTVRSLEFDGQSYWTLERIVENDADAGFIIRRWVIENFVMILQNSFTFQTNSNDDFESSAFTVEKYEGILSAGAAVNTSQLTVAFNDDPDGAIFGLLTPGTRLFIGPSTLAGDAGEFTTVTVNSTVGSSTVNLTAPLGVGFSSGNSIRFSKNLWFFNQHFLKTRDVGALYKVSALDGSILSRTQGGAFKDINACSFHNVQTFQIGTPLVDFNGHYLLFLRTNSLLFIDVNDPQLTTVLSAVQNNLSSDTTEVFNVSDLAIEGNTIFRLQTKFNINGQQSTETTFNYQLATFRPFPTAIALTAVEAIIPAGNGVSSSIITARVTDQYALPYLTSPAGTIQFSTTGGGSGSGLSNTGEIPIVNTNGEVVVTYTSGDTAGMVTISAEVFIKV